MLERLLGCTGGQGRINRFLKEYLPDNGCDSDTEEKLAYAMFIDDLLDMRSMISAALRDTLSGQLQAEKKFAKERDFYNEQNDILKSENARQKDRIE